EVLAVGRGAQALNHVGDPVKICEVKRRVGAERQPDTVCGERNAADEIEYRRPQSSAASEAMIDGDLEGVETMEIFTRPTVDRRTIPDANRRHCPASRHVDLSARDLSQLTLPRTRLFAARDPIDELVNEE